MKRTAFSISLLVIMVLVRGAHVGGRAGVADSASPVGTWDLNANGVRQTLTIGGPPTGPFTGSLIDENGSAERLYDISWTASPGLIEFPRSAGGSFQWYRATIAYGIITGRLSIVTQSPARPSIGSYK